MNQRHFGEKRDSRRYSFTDGGGGARGAENIVEARTSFQVLEVI